MSAILAIGLVCMLLPCQAGFLALPAGILLSDSHEVLLVVVRFYQVVLQIYLHRIMILSLLLHFRIKIILNISRQSQYIHETIEINDC